MKITVVQGYINPDISGVPCFLAARSPESDLLSEWNRDDKRAKVLALINPLARPHVALYAIVVYYSFRPTS